MSTPGTSRFDPTRFHEVDKAGNQDAFINFLKSAASSLDIQAVRNDMAADLRIQPGAAVLDVGCGIGMFTCELARLAGSSGRVIGLDLSEVMIAAARREATGGIGTG